MKRATSKNSNSAKPGFDHVEDTTIRRMSILPSRFRVFAFGLVAGATLLYLFDPKSGSSRRKALKDRVESLTKRAQQGFETAKDLSQQAQTTFADVRSKIAAHLDETDRTSDSRSIRSSLTDLH